jgi:hypothetical protein
MNAKALLPHGVVIPGDGSVTAEVVTLSPETAAAWLKQNHLNRPVRRTHVEFLAREITDGNWQLNGQAIVISDGEEVLDGQHRLLAVIEAGIAIKTMVVYGIKREAFKTIDTGATRTGADALILHFPDRLHTISKAVATSVPWCLTLEKSFVRRWGKISNTETLAYIADHQSLWHCAEYLGGIGRDTRPLSLGCGTALYEVTQRKDPELAEDFIRKLFTGEHLSAAAPEYLLRSALMKNQDRIRKLPIASIMRMCVKGWNWRRRGNDEADRRRISLDARDPERLIVL